MVLRSSSFLKFLKKGKISTGGRNNTGKITCWHRGGGHKRKFRFVDFFRVGDGVSFQVESFHYDPNRSASLILVSTIFQTPQLYFFYIIPQNISIGSTLYNGFSHSSDFIGICCFIHHFPVGSYIHNLEIFPGSGFKLVRSAGTSAVIVEKYSGSCLVRLPSGFLMLLSLFCKASFGTVGNEFNHHRRFYKAGQSRWLGRRPVVRGVAINPVDHPHGGGEGKSSGGRISVTPWGRYTKGIKTRKSLNIHYYDYL